MKMCLWEWKPDLDEVCLIKGDGGEVQRGPARPGPAWPGSVLLFVLNSADSSASLFITQTSKCLFFFSQLHLFISGLSL